MSDAPAPVGESRGLGSDSPWNLEGRRDGVPALIVAQPPALSDTDLR